MQVIARTLFSSPRIMGASSYQRSGHGLSTTMITIPGFGNSQARPLGSAMATTFTIPAVVGLLKPNSVWLLGSRFYCDSARSNPSGVTDSSGKTILTTSDMEKVKEFLRKRYEDCRAKMFENGRTLAPMEVQCLLLMMKYTYEGIFADIFFDAFKFCYSSIKVQEALGTPITFNTEDPSFAMMLTGSDTLVMVFKIRGTLNEGIVTMEWKKRVDGGLSEYTSLGVFVDGVPPRTIQVEIKSKTTQSN